MRMPEPITFHSQGARLGGKLWTTPGQRRPAVLVTGSWMTVKEQMPARYAPLLADAGFAAMTFDFRGFGESEGTPREVESGTQSAGTLRADRRGRVRARGQQLRQHRRHVLALNPRRGAIPEWGARFALMAWKEWLEFDPIALAPRVTVPVRLVTGEQTATPGGARKFEAAHAGAHDSVWMDGTQFDFYDDPKTVEVAARHAVEHLRATLT
jgi:hypothetical protein